MKFIAVLMCLVGIAVARAPYQFSDGYLEVLGGEPSQDFSCESKPYGYYADVANDCKVFHICLPIQDANGEVFQTFQYSFFCGNQTVFSQESLTCVHDEFALPCSEAETLYEISNADFGKIPEDSGRNQPRAAETEIDTFFVEDESSE